MTNMQPPYGSNWPEPPHQPKPRVGLWARIGLIFGGIVLFGVVVGLANGNDPAPVAQSAPATATSAPRATYAAPTYRPAPTTVATPVGPVTTFTDGMYEVGRDIAPGTYAAPGGRNCYWERSKDATGDSIIANDWAPGHGQVIAVAKEGEYLKVSDCGIWLPR